MKTVFPTDRQKHSFWVRSTPLTVPCPAAGRRAEIESFCKEIL